MEVNVVGVGEISRRKGLLWEGILAGRVSCGKGLPTTK